MRYLVQLCSCGLSLLGIFDLRLFPAGKTIVTVETKSMRLSLTIVKHEHVECQQG